MKTDLVVSAMDRHEVLTVVSRRVPTNSEKRLWTSSCLSFRPSAYPRVGARHPLDGFLWNLISGCFYENLSTLQIWLKWDNTIGHFTWRL